MFNLFKKKHSSNHQIEELLSNVFRALPSRFHELLNQLNDGLIIGFKKSNSPVQNFNKVLFNVPVLNKYENRKKGLVILKGIKVYDIGIQSYTELQVYLVADVVLGYSTPDVRNFAPDVSKINIDEFLVNQPENRDFEIVRSMVDADVLELISPNDVYEVKLEGNIYYHITDLEDGDFIAVDPNRKVFKITHDPFEVVELREPLKEILTR